MEVGENLKYKEKEEAGENKVLGFGTEIPTLILLVRSGIPENGRSLYASWIKILFFPRTNEPCQWSSV